MTTDRDLDEILAEIGREHRAIGAPESLEPVLRAAAGRRINAVGTPGLRAAWRWAAAVVLLAAVGTAGVIWQARKNHQPQNQQAVSVPAPQVEPGPTVSSAPVTITAPVRRAVEDRAGLRRGSSRQRATWNSLDEFVALPVSEGLPPAAEMSVVRVTLRGSDLQQYGLQTPPDAVAQTMLAEFVVGEDGLPRAIRIVR